MTIKETLFNLKNALGALEYHTDNLKKAIAIAEDINSAHNDLNLTFNDETFSDDAGYGARRFINTFEHCGDFEVDYLFKILSAVEEYEKIKK